MHSRHKKSSGKHKGGRHDKHTKQQQLPTKNEQTEGGMAVDNPNFDVQHSDVMGRYLVAKKNVIAGAFLIKESPLIVGPVQESKPMCLGCYALIPNISTSFRCEACKWPMCGPKCAGLSKEFGHSRAECETLSRIPEAERPGGDGDAIMYNAVVPLRCLGLKTSDPPKWNKLCQMEAHDDIRRGIPYIWEKNQKTVVDRIRKNWGLTEFTDDEIHTVCGYLEVNSFAIGQGAINIRALYPTIFLFSHDCVANTSHVDNEKYQMVIRATKPIQKGEAVTVSYAYTLLGSLKRRNYLKESKFFDCSCKRCSDRTELGTFISAVKCKCKTGYLLPEEPLNNRSLWVCQTSDCVFTKTADKILDLITRAEDEIEQIKGEQIQDFEAFLKKYENVFHPNHYHMLSAKYALSQMYGKVPGHLLQELSPSLLQRKLDICKNILQVFTVIEPGLSRLRGVTMYELHAPIMVLATSKFSAGVITKKEFKASLRKVVSYLKESQHILSFETKLSQEGMMCQAATDALEHTKEWTKAIGQF